MRKQAHSYHELKIRGFPALRFYEFKDVPISQWEEGQIKEHAYHKWEIK